MGDISSGISPVGGCGLPSTQATSLSTSQPLRGDGTIPEATTGNTTNQIVQNSRVSQSQTSISIASQRTQPQAAGQFGMMMLLSALISDDDEKNKSNPFMALVGLALMAALQKQSQSTQFLQFDSQSLEYSQSVTSTASISSQSVSYQQTTSIDAGGSVGGQIDVAG
ncbi:MAG: hypothetical protein H6818_20680 [Phycisphaerales bacterium]|nr:hypothetical protein [Phycisphaerales bacterium]